MRERKGGRVGVEREKVRTGAGRSSVNHNSVTSSVLTCQQTPRRVIWSEVIVEHLTKKKI